MNQNKTEVINPNVWIGSHLGLLKSVYFKNKSAKNHFETGKYGKGFEITSICWGCKEKTQIDIGLKNGIVKTYDPSLDKFTEFTSIPNLQNDQSLCSLKKIDEKFVTAVSTGQISIWSPDSENHQSINCGSNLTCIDITSDNLKLATGGKENSLKVWDLSNSQVPTFVAKNVKPDWLQLRVPIWVSNIHFLDSSDKKILTTTGTHNIRIYDTSIRQRRPVLESSFGEYPITASSIVERSPNKVYVGNSRGEIACFDIRKMKDVFYSFKGSNGSVRSIQNHPTLPYLFSCGLDRYLRVHDEKTRVIAHKVHLKSYLNCLLVTDSPLENESMKTDERKRTQEEVDMSKGERAEDDVWDEMSKVEDSDSESEDSVEIKTKKSRLD